MTRREDSTPLLTMEGGYIGYDGNALLGPVDLEIHRGDLWGIVGPNGAGKSTLLKSLLGIIPLVSGRRSSAPGLRFGYVPQRSDLDSIFPLSALDVVTLGGMGTRRGGGSRMRPASREEALEAMEALDVAKIADKPFRSLSGGQKQRVLMARGLVRKPDILVLDEPTAGMDIPSEEDLLDFIQSLNTESGMTVLLVMHQIAQVADRATHVALVNWELELFATGETGALVTTDELTSLYRRPMEVHRAFGQTLVKVARGGAAREAEAGGARS